MKKLMALGLLALSAALSQAQPQVAPQAELRADTPAPVNQISVVSQPSANQLPASQLYSTGLVQTEKGQLADARATLRSLVDAYPHDLLAIDAKGAIDATLLFEEGQSLVKAGKCKTARVAFETLIAVYPENPLAGRAKSAIEALAEKERASRVVKSMEFRDVPAVPAEELRAAMEAREVRLSVGKPCRSKDVEQARVALAEILAEKGIGHVRVGARTRSVPPDSVAVIFTVEKSRASLLRSPWRLALAGWQGLRPKSGAGE